VKAGKRNRIGPTDKTLRKEIKPRGVRWTEGSITTGNSSPCEEELGTERKSDFKERAERCKKGGWG